MVSKGVVKLKEDLQRVINETDWSCFNDQKTMITSIEVNALLVLGIKKCDKMIENIMADTITDKE